MRTNLAYKVYESEIFTTSAPQPTARPTLHVVNVDLVAHLYKRLDDLAIGDKFSNRSAVSFLKKGRLTHTTVYEMAQRGIPGRVAGLNKIDKMQDYSERLAALQRLVGLVLIFRFGKFDENNHPVTKLEQVTDRMIEDVLTIDQV